MSDIDLSAAIEVAARRIWRHATRDVAGGGVNREDCDRLAKHAVIAAAPDLAKAIEAAVREQIARDIEAAREVNPRFGQSRGDDIAFGRDTGLERAVAIARGEA